MTLEERVEKVAREIDTEYQTLHRAQIDGTVQCKTFDVETIIAAAIREAVDDEREACAQQAWDVACQHFRGDK